MVVYLISLSID